MHFSSASGLIKAPRCYPSPCGPPPRRCWVDCLARSFLRGERFVWNRRARWRLGLVLRHGCDFFAKVQALRGQILLGSRFSGLSRFCRTCLLQSLGRGVREVWGGLLARSVIKNSTECGIIGKSPSDGRQNGRRCDNAERFIGFLTRAVQLAVGARTTGRLQSLVLTSLVRRLLAAGCCDSFAVVFGRLPFQSGLFLQGQSRLVLLFGVQRFRTAKHVCRQRDFPLQLD
mmetsp:Transcript_21742/g.53655  ORF Transcript_21742/g.53655 Transcript_21742/m.53655 type:complete len:229 (+) Transcript_21742:92-778(+)